MNILLGLPLGIFRMLGVILMTALRFAPVVIVLVIGVIIWRKHRKMTQETGGAEDAAPKSDRRSPSFTGPVVTVDYKEVKEEDISVTPEPPAAFAHKPGWLVFRSRDPEEVCAALGFRDRKRANWTAGLAAVSPSRWFVSPSLEGWVVVVGEGGRPITEEEFRRLSRRFGEVQAYVSDREKHSYAWSLYRDGEIYRAYGIAGGRVFLDQGDWTQEEIALGFGRFPRRSGGPREGFPDQDAVLSISAAWGVDPLLEGAGFAPGVGWSCCVE